MKKVLIMLLILFCVIACVASLAQVFPMPGILLARETRVAPMAEARPLGEAFIVCKNSNVRPNPSATDRVLDWKLKGESVVVLEWVNGWARIGDSMYINGWLLCPQREARYVR